MWFLTYFRPVFLFHILLLRVYSFYILLFNVPFLYSLKKKLFRVYRKGTLAENGFNNNKAVAITVVRRCLQNSSSWKFCNIHRKIPVLEFLFNTVVGLSLQLYQKDTPTQVFSYEYYQFLRRALLHNTSGGWFYRNNSWVLMSVPIIRSKFHHFPILLYKL